MNVGIIGLGLIGGSLARDLHAAGWRVCGHDHNGASLESALNEGIVHRPLPTADAELGRLDLLVLAVPVQAALDEVRRLGRRIPRDSRLAVTDVGSTKRSILDAATASGLAGRFVGGHPVTGDHRSGWEAARPGLFRDATVWLCPAPDAGPTVLAPVLELWRTVGALPRRIGAADHDRRLAHTSHLPQVVASALGHALAAAGYAPGDLGPGGRGTTRLAGSDPGIWTEILLDNADEVRPAVDALVDALGALGRAMDRDDVDGLRGRLNAARDWSRTSTDLPTAV